MPEAVYRMLTVVLAVSVIRAQGSTAILILVPSSVSVGDYGHGGGARMG